MRYRRSDFFLSKSDLLFWGMLIDIRTGGVSERRRGGFSPGIANAAQSDGEYLTPPHHGPVWACASHYQPNLVGNGFEQQHHSSISPLPIIIPTAFTDDGEDEPSTPSCRLREWWWGAQKRILPITLDCLGELTMPGEMRGRAGWKEQG